MGENGGEEPLSEALKRVSPGALEAYAENIPQGLKPEALDNLYNGQPPMSRGHGRKDVTATDLARSRSRYGFIAVPVKLGCRA